MFVLVFTTSLFLVNCSSDDAVDAEPQEMDQDDDNPPTPLPSGDPEEVLKIVYLDFLNAINSINPSSMVLTRQGNLFDSYYNAVNNSTSSALWRSSYDILKNADLLQALNEQPDYNVSYHLGIAQILQSYAFFVMVDYMGDVPYTEANNPQSFPDPKADSGLGVYNVHLALLDTAIANLNASSSDIPEDYFYRGGFNKNNWITVANTLKIRAYTNLRLTDPNRARNGINATLNQNVIDLTTEDFAYNFKEYNYSGNDGIRSPLYFENYSAAGAGTRMSNSLYDIMNVGDTEPPFIEEGTVDPRARYYFYRQIDGAPQNSNLPCEDNPEYTYCYVGNLYWGRDHGDNEGLPNDALRRTAFGLYPAGGGFDNNIFIPTAARVNTLDGKGIFPLLLSSHVNFLLAENSLTLGTTGDTGAYLENGIRQSMAKVKSFEQEISTIDPETGEDYTMTSTEIEAYISEVMDGFNTASNTQKLAIIAKETFVASFGNGLETYNLYRRTGKPDFVAPLNNSGSFPRRFSYPLQYTFDNPNIDDLPVTNQIFWDNNPAGFID